MVSRSLLHSCIALLCLGLLSLPMLSYAEETAEELQSNLNALNDQIKALDAEIKSYSLKVGQTKGQAKTLKKALAQLEERRNGLTKDINYTKLRISHAQQNILYTKSKIIDTESVLAKNKKALTQSLRNLVEQEQHVPQFIGALAPGSHLSDALEISHKNANATHAITDKVRAVVEVKDELTLQKMGYELHKKTLENLKVTLADQKTLVEQTTKDKSTLLVQTNNKESEYQKLIAAKNSKKDQLESEMLDVESKLRVIVDSSKLPPTGKGVLQYPVKDVVITQYFGNTPFASKNSQVYNGGGHNGIDFGARVGTAIYSAGAGIVVGTGNTDTSCSGVSYGKWVLIRHANGLTTLYAHLSVIQVNAGDKVVSRQKIGLSGNTGYSTGPHLHFTVYASDSIHISGPTEYKSKICGTYMIMPLAPRAGYLNPLSYL